MIGLSKSKYTKGWQCPKMLWMDAHMPDLFDDSVMNESILEQGNEVGDMAMGYFGEYVEISFDSSDYAGMIARTRELVERGEGVVCEATFSYDGCLCMVDILRVDPDGVHIVEVKSSTHVKDVYVQDVSYQRWVLERCGMNVKTASLMYVNSDYVRQGELDLKKLFKIEDLSEASSRLSSEVEERVTALKRIAAQPDEPEVPFGARCSNPYRCGYRSWCWRDVPYPSVFDLNGKGPRKGEESWNRGVRTLEDALESEKMNRRQRIQAEVWASGEEQRIDRAALRGFLSELSFPLYFLDFETFMPAIPPFDGMRPFMQIPSQYSLHVVESRHGGKVHREGDGSLLHREFLGDSRSDPRRALAEALCGDIPKGACVLAYSMGFERSRIQELADAFPDLAEHLLSIRDGMRDLMDPFKSGDYYVREMGGSNSIKDVLPALYPGDPELDYHALEGVHKGDEAASAFVKLSRYSGEELERKRRELLAYCRLDTLAMVRIWEKIVEAAS